MMTHPTDKPATGGRRRNRRRQYVVNSAFQWKLAATITLTVFLVSTIMGSIVCYIFHYQARMRPIDPRTYTTSVTYIILIAAVGFALVTAMAVGLWSILLTHRICGPLMVMRRFLIELKDGHLPKSVRPLRRRDEFKEIYGLFSEAIKTLRAEANQQVGALADAIREARAAKELDGDARDTALESLATELEALQQKAADSLGDRIERQVERPAKREVREPDLSFACK